jgi:hypothetical protein
MAASARCPAAVLLFEPVGESLGPTRVGEPETGNRDRRLVVVLLEEHPLEYLRSLVSVFGDEARALAEEPQDRA